MLRSMVLTAVAMVAVGAVAGCSSSGSTPARWTAPTVDPAGSKAVVCAKIRSDLTKRIDSIGGAMGKLVGANTADDHDSAQAAQASITAQLSGIATDLTQDGAKASDTSLRSAATRAARSMSALAGDDSYVSGIDSLDDIPGAIGKISTATQPIADACR